METMLCNLISIKYASKVFHLRASIVNTYLRFIILMIFFYTILIIIYTNWEGIGMIYLIECSEFSLI